MALAEIFGEPLWCVGTGLRNTHLRAIVPTVSNSKLSGNVSPGIEPWAANVFTEQSAKGTFIRKNPTLKKILRKPQIFFKVGRFWGDKPKKNVKIDWTKKFFNLASNRIEFILLTPVS